MRGERGDAEDVGGQALLSALLLGGLLPEAWGQLKDAALGPCGQEAEEVAEVRPRLDAVELAETKIVLTWAPSSLPRNSQFLRPRTSRRRLRSET